jgi:nickel-dependent lactate racemase
MLEALRAGSPSIEITLLVATGFHRGTTHAELKEKLGQEIVASERIVIHDSQNAEQNVRIAYCRPARRSSSTGWRRIRSCCRGRVY